MRSTTDINFLSTDGRALQLSADMHDDLLQSFYQGRKTASVSTMDGLFTIDLAANFLAPYFLKLIHSTAPILVAFSGGKDSVAMVLHLLELGVAKDRIHLHHHDVDGRGEDTRKLFDWQCTETYCKAFAAALGLHIFFSYRSGGIMREVYRNNEAKQDVLFQKAEGGAYLTAPSKKTAINTRMKFPAVSASLMTRWCSATAKIEVLSTAIAHNDNYLGQIFIMTGERRQESTNRSKYASEELHRSNALIRPAFHVRPIIDWTDDQVWSIIKRWNIQPHPAYMIGWNRCSCQLCIFSSPDVWASIAAISPEKVDAIAQTEMDINFTLYSAKTIRQKVAEGKAFTMDPYWTAQATGEFTAPIFVQDQWLMPIGAINKQAAGSL